MLNIWRFHCFESFFNVTNVSFPSLFYRTQNHNESRLVQHFVYDKTKVKNAYRPKLCSYRGSLKVSTMKMSTLNCRQWKCRHVNTRKMSTVGKCQNKYIDTRKMSKINTSILKNVDTYKNVFFIFRFFKDFIVDNFLVSTISMSTFSLSTISNCIVPTKQRWFLLPKKWPSP